MSPLVSARFLQTQPDARLLALARAGYERAFEALVNRYRRQLLAYCRRLSASDAGAEDILQQALLQAWVAIRGDSEVRDVRPWLYRIVHNVAISHMRRPQADVIELQASEGAGGADHEVERRFAARQALEGLAALPELQREVMLGTAVQGRSHEELAATLGLSNGAVRGLIYRARATLRAAAAAFIPGPLVNWAARHGGGSGRAYEAIAGSGSAGLAGLLLKGGAVVATAGALATATGVTASAPSHRHHRDAATSRTAARAAAPAHARTELVSDHLLYGSASQPAGGGAGRGQARHSSGETRRASGGREGSSGLSGSSQGGPSDGSSRGGPGSTSGGRSGPGGSGSGGSGSGEGSKGSGGSGDGGDGGSDGGSHKGPGSGGPGGSGGSGGSGGGSDGGSRGSGSGGGSDGGSSGSGSGDSDSSSGSGSGDTGSSGSGSSGSGSSGSGSSGSGSSGSTSGGSSGSDGGSVSGSGTTTSDGDGSSSGSVSGGSSAGSGGG